MFPVHWVLRPLLLAVCTVQFTLALLAYLNFQNGAILADCIVNLAVAVWQIPSLAFGRFWIWSVASTNTVLYLLYVGITIWLRQVVEHIDKEITYPPNFLLVQYSIGIAGFVLMGSSLTLMWLKVGRTKTIEDSESMLTITGHDTREGIEKSPKVEPEHVVRLSTPPFLPKPPRVHSLHKRSSEGTLVTPEQDSEQIPEVNLNLSLANSVYDDTENWMDTKPMKVADVACSSVPLSLLVPVLHPKLSIDWDARTLGRRQSTGQLIIKKQRVSQDDKREKRRNEARNEARNTQLDENTEDMAEAESGYLSFNQEHGNLIQAQSSPSQAHQRTTKFQSITENQPDLNPEADLGADYMLSNSDYTLPAPNSARSPNCKPHSLHLHLDGPVLLPVLSESNLPVPGLPGSRLSCIMDGLEDIPLPPPKWTESPQKLSTISLDQWEQHKSAWLAVSTKAAPNLFVGSPSRTLSAPSLHTFRQVSSKSEPSEVEYQFAPEQFCTPVASREPEQSPIRKMMGKLRNSPKRWSVSSHHSPQHSKYSHHSPQSSKVLRHSPQNSKVFKHSPQNSKLLRHSPSHSFHKHLLSCSPTHKHTQSVANSMASFLASLASGKSTRSDSPRKLKAFFAREKPKFNLPSAQMSKSESKNSVLQGDYGMLSTLGVGLLPGYNPSWEDLENLGSRQSSVPSAIVGEYDKEKWRTLKELEKQAELDMAL